MAPYNLQIASPYQPNLPTLFSQVVSFLSPLKQNCNRENKDVIWRGCSYQTKYRAGMIRYRTQ